MVSKLLKVISTNSSGPAMVQLVYQRNWEPKEWAIDQFAVRIDVLEKAP